MHWTWPRPAHLLLVLPLVGVFAWLVMRGQAVRDDPAAVLAALRASQALGLPAAAAISADARTPVESYDRETLYEFIDGAAEAYISNGFEKCVAATYTLAKAGASAPEISAELYRFASDAGARAQRDAEKPSTAQPIANLGEAWTDGAVLLAVRGRDMLKLTALSQDRSAAEAMVRLAAVWHKEHRR